MTILSHPYTANQKERFLTFMPTYTQCTRWGRWNIMHSYSQYLNLISSESAPTRCACFNALSLCSAIIWSPFGSHLECHNTHNTPWHSMMMMMDSTVIKHAFASNCINFPSLIMCIFSNISRWAAVWSQRRATCSLCSEVPLRTVKGNFWIALSQCRLAKRGSASDHCSTSGL